VTLSCYRRTYSELCLPVFASDAAYCAAQMVALKRLYIFDLESLKVSEDGRQSVSQATLRLVPQLRKKSRAKERHRCADVQVFHTYKSDGVVDVEP